MLFKLSNLNSNLALTLGYLNPALNNSALANSPGETTVTSGETTCYRKKFPLKMGEDRVVGVVENKE